MTQPLPDLKSIQGWLIDMDGVLWRGQQALPGLAGFFSLLRERALPLMLVTNNARTSPTLVQSKLLSLGVDILPEEVLTSAMAAAAYLQQEHPGIKKGFVLGESALREALEDVGIEILESGEGAQAVVVGLDFGITYSVLAEACYAIGEGALLIGTNPDRSIPTERGLAPGNGAILAALEATTGTAPVIVGKPEPFLYREAAKRLGTTPEASIALGDRLETDVLGGQRAHMRTALLLTGVTRVEELETSSIRPDWVFQDLPSLLEKLN